MSQVVKLVLGTAFVFCLQASGWAQLTVPPSPLPLEDDLATVQTSANANFSDARCDQDGTVYLRHESAGDDASKIVRISSDGTVEQVQLAPVPGFGATHTFAITTSEGGAVQEVVRAWDTSDPSDSPSIYYLQFAADGSFRSRRQFAHEFIPALLLPLPSGNFFAAGVLMKDVPGTNDTEEVPVTGIFNSDTRLISKLQNAPAKAAVQAASSSADGEALQSGHVVLGDDGNLYVLLSARNTRVRVYRQTGELLREMTLQQPFEHGLATGIWVSDGRLVVTYDGKADDRNHAATYIEYDSNSGQLIRTYRPQFTGMVACFKEGQTLTVLVNNHNSRKLEIGSVELQ